MHFFEFSEEKFSKFLKFFSKFPNNLCRSPKREKTHGKFFEKYVKILHYRNFLNRFFLKISKKLSFSSKPAKN